MSSAFTSPQYESKPVSVVGGGLASPLDPSAVQASASPGHLQAVAHLYGVSAVDVAGANVLELGCGSGQSLCTYAQTWTQARFVGIDILPDALEQAQLRRSELGLSNVEFVCTTLDQLLAADLGTFDYILVHGVFSLIQGESRSALMSFCRRHLSPAGLMYFAFSTLPGAKLDELVGDAIQLHTSLAQSDQEQLHGARAMLAFLAEGLDVRNSLAPVLKHYASLVEKEPDQWLLLKYFEGLGRPSYILDVLSMAQHSELGYVGDANPRIEVLAGYGEKIEQFNHAINPSENRALGLQYLDFSALRSVRSSLFVRTDYPGEIFSQPDLSRLSDLRWAMGVRRVLTESLEVGNGFTTSLGGVIATDDELMLRLLDVFAAAWPNALSVEQLCLLLRDAVGVINNDAVPVEVVSGLLQRLFIQGAPLRVCLREPEQPAVNAEGPRLWPNLRLALQKAHPDEAGRVRVSAGNVWSEQVDLDLTPDEYDLLLRLDDQVSFAQMRQTMRAKEMAALLECLLKVHHNGLLGGSNSGLQALFRAFLGQGNMPFQRMQPYAYALLLHALPRAHGGWGQVRLSMDSSQMTEQELKLKPRFNAVAQAITAGNTETALALAQAITADHPLSVLAWQNRTRASLECGAQEGGVAYALHALSLDSQRLELYFDLAFGLWWGGYLDSAERILSHALAVNPDYGPGWDVLGSIFRAKGQAHLAFRCCQQAARLMPKSVKILSNLGNILAELSRWKEGAKAYRQALALAPDAWYIRSNLLFLLTQDETVSKQSLFKEHQEFGALLARKNGTVAAKPGFTSSPDKKVPRLGFISGDLRGHAVSSFFLPVLESLQQSPFEIYIYNNNPSDDLVTDSLRAYGHVWRPITAVSDEAVLKQIRADQIDILVDLSGHTGHNRLPLLSMRAAPIQASWIGYPGTTGLKTMDYFIHYAGIGIGELDEQFTEKLVYLPKVYGFQPYSDSPDVSGLPMRTNGYITFGSFNRPGKLGMKTLDLWAAVLKAIPSARLLMGAIQGQAMENEFVERFEKLGIGRERLRFSGRLQMRDYLEKHAQVDVLLDAYPYGGGTTTYHAAWMGVPTLTLAGPTLAGRSSMVLMSQYGLTNFVARTEQQFVELALAWSKRADELAVIRGQLRAYVQDTGDQERLTTYLEKAFMLMWQRWRDGLPPASIEVPID